MVTTQLKRSQHDCCGPLRVLLVEDDPDTRTVLLEALHDEGVDARACATGDEALGVLQRDRFDALVTDQVMPGMSGLELVGFARALDADLRCVVVSGYGPPGGAGVAWLKKPFSLSALLAAIAQPSRS